MISGERGKVERIRAVFEERAKRYDAFVTRFVGKRELACITPFLPEEAEVLDFGCGTGRVTLALLRKRCKVSALDFSPAMVEQAKARVQNAGFSAEFFTSPEALWGRRWPFITCVGVVDYYPNLVLILGEMKKFLAPGGKMLLSFPNVLSPLSWIYALGALFFLPVYPKLPFSVKSVLLRKGFRVLSVRYAFPAIPFLGMTCIFLCEEVDDSGKDIVEN
ncbi:MAG: class I SAM-dependent methyltransferase [bacterium]